MNTYKIKLTGLNKLTIVAANTKLGLLKKYNKYLIDCGHKKLSLNDFENEKNISFFLEYGEFEVFEYNKFNINIKGEK